MSSGYSEELKKKAKEKLLEQFDLLCKVGYGKIEISFNVKSKNILIVPSPYLRVEDSPNKKIGI